jgi:nucleotide-binding universal stress UspA family protein
MTESAIVRWGNPELILMATNLLEGNALALQAINQARLSKAKVLLVHVIPASGSMTEINCGMPVLLPNSLVRNAKAKLDDIAKDFQREGIECEPIVITGLPEEEIPRLVKSRSVDRVVITDRNTTGVARFTAGSVADELIANLEVPVCVIGRRTHLKAANGPILGRVLLATSFRSESSLLAKFAMAVAKLNHSHLTLLHVLDTIGMSEQDRELGRLAARRRLFALVPNAAMYRNQPFLLVREGDPAAIIMGEASSMSADLIILGSPRTSMISRLLGANVVHRVVAESQCPVITIRFNSESSTGGIRELARTDAVVTPS